MSWDCKQEQSQIHCGLAGSQHGLCQLSAAACELFPHFCLGVDRDDRALEITTFNYNCIAKCSVCVRLSVVVSWCSIMQNWLIWLAGKSLHYLWQIRLELCTSHYTTATTMVRGTNPKNNLPRETSTHRSLYAAAGSQGTRNKERQECQVSPECEMRVRCTFTPKALLSNSFTKASSLRQTLCLTSSVTVLALCDRSSATEYQLAQSYTLLKVNCNENLGSVKILLSGTVDIEELPSVILHLQYV